MHFGVYVVVIGTTLGIGGCNGADSGAAKEVNCGSGDGVTLRSVSGAGRSSGREVCWRKMLLSWSS
jgi:hypothetical protein